jgi:hypothetical protein
MSALKLTYPPPANEQDFEELCLQVLRTHYDRPHLELYAHRGEKQYGVDIFDPSGQRPNIAAQCKLHNFLKGLRPSTLRQEVSKAKSFYPSIDSYLFLTSAKRTAAAQQAIIAVNREHRSQGLFLVELLTWERIESLLHKYPHVASLFYRTLASESVDRLEQDLASIRKSVSALNQTLASVPAETANGAISLIEHSVVGDQIGSSGLCGEFLKTSPTLVVWEESMEGPRAPVLSFERETERATSYSEIGLGELIPYATRIRATSDGGLVCIQERDSVMYVDPTLSRVTPGITMPRDNDPIIRSEAIHPADSLIVVGTDYGMLVAWNWVKDSVVFQKRYFPRNDIVWMTGLAIDANKNTLLFVEGNVLYEVRLRDGDVLSKKSLGSPEETGKIAFHGSTGLLAVGSLMYTRLYDNNSEPQLLWEVPNPLPLVHEICFSPNGKFLAVLAGTGLGGTAVMLIDVSTGRVLARHAQVWPPKDTSLIEWMRLGIRWISFSSGSDLLAVGEGGRVGIYALP